MPFHLASEGILSRVLIVGDLTAHQTPNMKWAPKSAVIDHEVSVKAYGLHMVEQCHMYKRNVFVNLVDHKGHEGQMEQAFGEMVHDIG